MGEDRQINKKELKDKYAPLIAKISKIMGVEKPKQPKIIRYVWWDGFNKEAVEEIFPTVSFGRRTAYDEDPFEVVIHQGGNRVRYIEGGVYLCCELDDNDTEIFTLSKKEFEEKYNNLLER